jgi:hypothetical protein
MSDDLKDWPSVLERNAAICILAEAIFRARGAVYGGSNKLTEQPPHVRQQYITRADELLTTLAPGRIIVTGLHGKVVGGIFQKEGGAA